MRIIRLLQRISITTLTGLTLIVSTACAEEADLLRVRNSFTSLWPGVAIDGVNRTAVEGLFEVVTEEGVAYYLLKSNHIIIGKMFDKNGQDLSSQALDKVSKERFAILANAKDKAILVGSGPIEVIEVTNPDCSYCRKMERFWKKRTDVTRYVFVTVDTSNPESIQKAKLILAANDSVKALSEALTGKYDFAEDLQVQHNDHGLQAVHQQLVEKSRLGGTPVYLIKGIFVNGADIDKIESILADAK